MRSTVRLLLALLLATSAFSQTTATQVDPALYSGLRWRLLGPFRAGRITSVVGVPSDPAVYYVGTPDGGVWKTSDGGRVWKPTMDALKVSSIGAVAVAPSNANIVYAGTGEESPGEGMFKSTDAGATWTNVGLKDSHYIAAVVVDPRNADVVTVAVSGPTEASEERGVYRTTDGGRSWKRVLFLDNITGAVDLSATSNGRTMLVSTMRRPSPPPQQTPLPLPAEQAKAEGPDSRIYKSTDGGANWKPAGENGLPADQRGRVGVAVGEKGRRLFAIMDQGLFRSDDGGESWKRITTDPRVIGSSYFSKVFVNPQNADEVYVAQTSMYRSRDGGVTFESWNGAPSGDDVHTLWINPADSRHMILGIDQGAIISMDAGATWTEWFNQATGQFYHVTTDNQFPYHAFAAQQDSGSIATLSRSNYGEITYRDWFSPAAFEVAHILADPLDPDIIYASGWYDTLIRFQRSTGQFKHVFVPGALYHAATAPPIAFVPQNPNMLLLGADKVLATTDRGETWKAVSPELTKAAPPASRRGGRPVITALAPSPVQQGVIWAGSGDGLIHITRDGGETWENISPTKENSDLNLEKQQAQGGLPASVFTPGGVAVIEAGHFDAGTAYAVYQMFRNPVPLVIRTHDFGEHWKSIAAGLPQEMAWAVREDPVRKGLLYAAVGHGIFVSFDDGNHWQSLQLNLPVTQVRDIAVHGNDVLVATYGRALWVLDDVSPLRQLGPDVANTAVHFFQPAPALRVRWDMNDDTPLPPETPAAANPPDGAILDYYLRAPARAITLEIRDAQGQLIHRFTTTPEAPPAQPANAPEYWFEPMPALPHAAGLNRFVWDLRYPHPPVLTYGYFGAHLDYFEYTLPDHAVPGETPRWQPQGPLVAPGKYEVMLNVDGQTFRQTLEVKPDPRVHATPAGYEAQLAVEQRLDRGMAASYDAWNQAHAAHQALSANAGTQGSALDKELGVFESGSRDETGFGPLNRDLGRYAEMAGTADGQPSALLLSAVTAECGELDKALARWKELNAKEIAEFNASAQQKGQKPLPVVANIPAGCGP
jgi:photosystem II stability/assembly factor-like uncharacterized protein